jgi:hypothetical protein
MTLALDLRRFALTVHIVVSVGWVGIVAGFLALAIAGMVSPDTQLVRASYIAMDLTYRTVVIPLGLASAITGVISSFGTDWGLFRHYWVIVKILLTTPAVALMLLHLRPVECAARAASAFGYTPDDLTGLRTQLVVYAIAALLVLLTATALSTYKPRGRTRLGARRSPANGPARHRQR